jgi:hypothetical protein
MTLGLTIRQIPIEEFLFYFLGFWFIVLFYALNDEIFLRKYNIDDEIYYRYARRLKKKLRFYFTRVSLLLVLAGLVVFTVLKLWLNPGRVIIPGYIIFLSVFAYIPFLFFWRTSRYFVNSRALVFTIVVTTLISLIWEVTLALPRGYWDYNHDYMVGIFVPFWNSLPIEAVTVWIFSSLIVLSYEYTKIILLAGKGKKIPSPRPSP